MKAHKKALSTKSTDGDLSAIAEAKIFASRGRSEEYSKRYDTQSEKNDADVLRKERQDEARMKTKGGLDQGISTNYVRHGLRVLLKKRRN